MNSVATITDTPSGDCDIVSFTLAGQDFVSISAWLKDKYGVSWQISPRIIDEMLSKGTQEQKKRVTQVFLKMKKFDIARVKKAFEG